MKCSYCYSEEIPIYAEIIDNTGIIKYQCYECEALGIQKPLPIIYDFESNQPEAYLWSKN